MKKVQEAEKERLRQFRRQIEETVNKFVADGTQQRYTFPSMDHTRRAVVQDVADVAGMVCHSFGVEDVDRHVVVFKHESLPCDEELAAMRRGETYDPEVARLRRQQQQEEAAAAAATGSRRKHVVPASNYKEKYEHLIGKAAGKSAAQATVVNKQFGYVPAANKRDQRSIEQTLADIQQKKKQKADDSQA